MVLMNGHVAKLLLALVGELPSAAGGSRRTGTSLHEPRLLSLSAQSSALFGFLAPFHRLRERCGRGRAGEPRVLWSLTSCGASHPVEPHVLWNLLVIFLVGLAAVCYFLSLHISIGHLKAFSLDVIDSVLASCCVTLFLGKCE